MKGVLRAASYIEREAVLAKQYNASNFVNPMLAEMVVDVRDIEDIPAADVEFVNHGWWIDRGEWVDCSECGTVGSPQWKRCPVCEAKMETLD